MATNVFNLLATLSLDTKGFEEDLDKSKDEAEKSGGKIHNALSKGAKGLATTAKVAGAAITSTATAVGGLAVKATESYAEFEQLTGGIETLYGTGGKTLEQFSESIRATTDDLKKSGVEWEKYADAKWMTDGGGMTGMLEELQYNYERLGGDTKQFSEEMQEYLHFEYDLSVEDAQAAVESFTNAISDETAQKKFEASEKANVIALENASKAYKTAGMSANEYMEASIMMAGALNKSTGDTERSAKLADVAITDMADNVNKMGTSMESVQNAYAGFAKGNYSMLDNLALGYSGSKEGMEELLATAQSISGVEYDISSYADVVEAIHVVQSEMGISGISAEEAAEAVKNGTMTEEEAFEAMGTTAKEATGTIQGSFNMTKSAWDNLVTAMAGGGDVSESLDALTESAGYFLDNAIPIFSKAIEGIADVIEKLAPTIAEKLPPLLEKILPPLLSAASKLVESFTKNLPTLLKQILPPLLDGVIQVIRALVDALPEIVGMIVDVLPDIIAAIIVLIPPITEALIKSLGEVLFKIFGALIDLLPDGLGDFLKAFLNGIKDLGKYIFKGWVDLFKNLPDIASFFHEKFSKAVEAIKKAFSGIGKFFKGVWKDITGVFKYAVTFYKDLFAKVWEAIKSAFDKAGDFFKGVWNVITAPFKFAIEFYKNLFTNVWNAITAVFDKAGEFFTGVWNIITYPFKKAVEFYKNLFSNVWEAITTPFDTVGEFFTNIWNLITAPFVTAKEWFTGIFQDAWNGVKSITDTLWNGAEGIFNIIKGAIEGIAGFFEDIGEGVVECWNTVTEWVGKIAEEFWGMIESALEWGAELAERFWEGVKSGAKNLYDVIMGNEEEHVAVHSDRIENFKNNGKWSRLNGAKTANGASSDTNVTVYIGQEQVDDIVVNNEQRRNYRSGGR